jgi:hypothetical protein
MSNKSVWRSHPPPTFLSANGSSNGSVLTTDSPILFAHVAMSNPPGILQDAGLMFMYRRINRKYYPLRNNKSLCDETDKL